MIVLDLPWPHKSLSPNARVCVVEGCDRPHDARGYCRAHGARLARYGDPLAGGKFRGQEYFCSIEGCGRPEVSRGWCETHYSRWRAHGDPLAEVRAVDIWPVADDEFLRANHGRLSIRELSEHLRRTMGSVRSRITRLGIAKKEYWSEAEEAALRELYTNAGRDGVLNLNAFAREVGRDPGNVSRKAKLLGLETNLKRRVVEQRKVKLRKYATDAELREAISERAKRMIQEKGHPRGMLGKHHSPEVREALSRVGQQRWAAMSEEDKTLQLDKQYAGIKAVGGRNVAQMGRGSWKAGWRDIGGKRNFYRSRWEANYARYLEWLKSVGEIADWKHEPETFWFDAIKRGVRSYKPDFRVWENNGSSALHEVKGWFDARSKTTLKRMAKYHPQEKIIVVDGHVYRAIRRKVMGMIEGWEDSKRDAHV